MVQASYAGANGRRWAPMTRPHTGERLIGVLVPPVVPRRPSPQVPLARLPHHRHPANADDLIVDVARLDPCRGPGPARRGPKPHGPAPTQPRWIPLFAAQTHGRDLVADLIAGINAETERKSSAWGTAEAGCWHSNAEIAPVHGQDRPGDV